MTLNRIQKMIIILILFIFSNPGFGESRINEVSNTIFSQKNFNYDNLGYFYLRKIYYSGSRKYSTSFTIPGDKGSIIHLNSSGNYVSEELKACNLIQSGNIYIKTDNYHYILGQGYTYSELGNGTIKSISKAQIRISKGNGNWLVTYSYPIDKNQFAIMWGIGSQNELINFSENSNSLIWSGYDLDVNARLSYDGYYYISPNSYVPYEKNSYWRIPSAYITNSLIKTGGSLASNIMGTALLQISEDNLCEDGYLKTLPKSKWLEADYKISGSFFDTRFNADTIETFLVGYQKFSIESFRNTYLKLADYYIKHGQMNHYSILNNEGIEGWLVEDYYYEGGEDTHCSLNHQLQAIHVFYQLYLQEKDDNYLTFADILLQGVKNTRNKWIMENYNLEYAYLADGSMGLTDYPYLTYNDLINVQNDIKSIRGEVDKDIQFLINAKRIWMDQNNIKGYKKQ